MTEVDPETGEELEPVEGHPEDDDFLPPLTEGEGGGAEKAEVLEEIETPSVPVAEPWSPGEEAGMDSDVA